MSNIIIVIVTIILIGAIYFIGLSHGLDMAKEEINQQKIVYLKQVRDIEREYKEKADRVESIYLNELDEVKQQYETKITNITTESLSNTRVCNNSTNTDTRVSKETSNKSNLICYTKSQLLDKIRESMDIARECDEIALKYKALYEVCK